jgi:signal transduction histidine kinase
VLLSSLEDVHRIIRLSEGLLLLSRVRTGAPAPRQPVDLEPLLLDVQDVAARLAEERGVTVAIGRTEPLVVHGERRALWRAVLNLAENAVKYTPPGGRVELRVARDAGHAVVEVRDTGVGMDPADVEKIFDPFVRLDAARRADVGGFGLGLSIVRSIVAAHGGTLSVQTAPGAGSMFSVRLPLARPADAHEPGDRGPTQRRQ